MAPDSNSENKAIIILAFVWVCSFICLVETVKKM